MDIFHDLWIPNISLLEKAIRSILVYLFLLIALRLGGKRELGQITGFDIVVLLLLSNTVQNAIIGDDNSLFGGCFGAAILMGLDYIVVRLAYHYPFILRLVEGTSTLLVKDGQIIQKNLAAEVITESELNASLRRQGFRHLSDVEAAILETNGSLTVEQSDSSDLRQTIQKLDERLAQIEAKLDRLS